MIFCNDLHLHLVFLDVLQFADDTTLYLSHKHPGYLCFCVETNLINIQDWFNANKLTLNLEKSVLMHFNSKDKKESISVCIGGKLLPVVKSTKFLGVFIDENLKWTTHIKNLLLKLKAKSCLFSKGKYLLNSHAKKMVYFAQVHSNLLYGILMWGNMIQKSDLRKLQKIQDSCVQMIHPHSALEVTYKTNRILTLSNLLKLENCKLWYKFYNGLLPRKLHNIMSIGSSQELLVKSHGYNTQCKN